MKETIVVAGDNYIFFSWFLADIEILKISYIMKVERGRLKGNFIGLLQREVQALANLRSLVNSFAIFTDCLIRDRTNENTEIFQGKRLPISVCIHVIF